MSESKNYIQYIRNKVGHDEIILTFAGCVVYNSTNQILLQKRGDSGLWGFPGGAIELHESAEEAAVREVLEETGLTVKINNLLGIYSKYLTVFPNGDKAQTIVIMFKSHSYSGELTCDNIETDALSFFDIGNTPTIFCQLHEDILSDIRNAKENVYR